MKLTIGAILLQLANVDKSSAQRNHLSLILIKSWLSIIGGGKNSYLLLELTD